MSPITVTFLGTSSGGGPSESRNCSSLVCDIKGDGSLWMVDCAEGTLRQFFCQSPDTRDRLKLSRITKLFISHMHADHIMGIVPLLRNILYPPLAEPPYTRRVAPTVEIYGPAGIRTFVRSIMTMTLTKTANTYTVHELLTPDDPVTPCEPPTVLHSSEAAGRDFRPDDNGFWTNIVQTNGPNGEIRVDAGAILHRDPCIGFVMYESNNLRRKLVILGDTYDASAMAPLCVSPSPSLLVHEATDAYIPPEVDRNARRSEQTVAEKCMLRGHSTPEMAGLFAKSIRAQSLILNHIGGRFPAPRYGRDPRAAVMQEIERKASAAWGFGHAQAAWDYMRVVIPNTPNPDVSNGRNRESARGRRLGSARTGGPYQKRKRSPQESSTEKEDEQLQQWP